MNSTDKLIESINDLPEVKRLKELDNYINEHVIAKDMLLYLAWKNLNKYEYTNDEKYIEHEIVNAGPRTFMFALVPEFITGKMVKEA